jgi:ketosteroid isomerase-like protein
MQTKVIPAHSVEAREIEDIVREHLAAFARGDFDAWGERLASNVFFMAADPEEVFRDRQAAVAEMHKDFDFAFDEGLQMDLEPQSFHVGISPDGSLAWSAAPLSYKVSFQGETNSFMLRHTSVLAKVDHQWSILATQYSLTLPEARVLEALTGGYLPAPHAIGDARQIGAQGLFKEFIHHLAGLFTAPIHQDASAFGPFPGEYADGERQVRALFEMWAARWTVLYLRPDGIRAELTSKESGWVAANVEAPMSHDGRQARLPLRFLVVYQKEGDAWAIAHAHLSVGIPDELAE